MRAVWQRTVIYAPLAFFAVGLALTAFNAPDSGPLGALLGIGAALGLAYWLGRRSRAEATAVAVAQAVSVAVADARAEAASQAHSQALSNVQLVLGDAALERLAHHEEYALDHGHDWTGQIDSRRTDSLPRPGLMENKSAQIGEGEGRRRGTSRSGVTHDPAPYAADGQGTQTDALRHAPERPADRPHSGATVAGKQGQPGHRVRSTPIVGEVPRDLGLSRYLARTSPHEGESGV